MKLVNIKTSASREKLMSLLGDSERVNKRVKFDESRGRPLVKMKEKKGRITLTCEMIGGPSKDNGFFVGCFFLGSIKQKGDETKVSGIILTAPLFHLIIAAFCIYFLIQSFIVGGITLVPLIGVVFTAILYKDEYKKEGIIKRFIARAVRIAEGEAAEDGCATDGVDSGEDSEKPEE